MKPIKVVTGDLDEPVRKPRSERIKNIPHIAHMNWISKKYSLKERKRRLEIVDVFLRSIKASIYEANPELKLANEKLLAKDDGKMKSMQETELHQYQWL